MLDPIERERYAFVANTRGGYHAPNPLHNWQVQMRSAGVNLHCRSECNGQDWGWQFAFDSYGYGDEQQPVSRPELRLDGRNQLIYRWDEILSASYVNGAQGVKETFYLDQPPQRSWTMVPRAPLVLQLAVHSDLRPRLEADGQAVLFVDAHDATVLRYGALHVVDRRGRTLPAHLEIDAEASGVSPYSLRIVVDDEHALYPLSVDPLITNEIKKLAASDPGFFGRFGISVALDGDTALVGAPLADGGPDNNFPEAGAAYLFGLQDVPDSTLPFHIYLPITRTE